MRRDLELVRQIAFLIEEKANGYGDPLESEEISIEGFNDSQIDYHCELMREYGFFECSEVTDLSSEFEQYTIARSTTAGHDFVDSARNEGIWKKATVTITSKIGGVSLDVFVQYLKSLAMDQLGMKNGS